MYSARSCDLKENIVFPKDFYTVEDKGNRKVTYASQEQLESAIVQQYATASVGEKMTEEEMEQHRPFATKVNVQQVFQGKKPNTGKDAGDAIDGADGPPISESHFPIKEETEILINEKGKIIGEKLRENLPR